jgi:type II secretory pathway component PulK
MKEGRHNRKAPSHEGSALIAVVFTLLVASALAASLMEGTRTDLQLSINYERELEAGLVSEAGIAAAILTLSDPRTNPFALANGRSFSLDIGQKPVQVAIESEAGKINLNHKPNPLLKRLLETVCPDHPGTQQLWAGIEAALGSTPQGERAFRALEEIGRLPGASAGLLAAIEPYVSVFSFREVPDYGLAPQRLQSLMAEGGNATGIAAAQSQRNNTGVPNAGIFTIRAKADGSAAAPLEATVYITGDAAQPYKLLAWRQKAQAGEAECQR